MRVGTHIKRQPDTIPRKEAIAFSIAVKLYYSQQQSTIPTFKAAAIQILR